MTKTIKCETTVSILPDIDIKLVHSDRKAEKIMNGFGLDCDPINCHAQTSYIRDNKTGAGFHLVVMRTPVDTPHWQESGLLCHEAVHIAERYFEEIGEEQPGEEERAYVVQSVASLLIDEHFKWKKRKLESPGR